MGEAVERPHVVNLVGETMLLVATDPVMLVADLQDGPGQDLSASRRATPFTAAGLGDLRIRVALGPHLPGAFHHGGVARDVALGQDRRDDGPLRDMATAPDNLDLHPIGSRALDNDLRDQTPQQGRALVMPQLRARPPRGQAPTQGQQVLAELRAQRRFRGRLGKAACGLFGLAQRPERVLPVAFEFGGGEPVRWGNVLVSAPGQVGAEAGLSHLLLLVLLQTLVVTLALRQHLVQGLKLGGRWLVAPTVIDDLLARAAGQEGDIP